MMTTSSFKRLMLSALLLSAPLLAGCDTLKEQMGMNRRQPDEFAVLTRAPLQMPPASQTSLPVPQPGMPRPQEVSAIQSAETALLGQAATTADQESAGEASLLERAGATQAQPNIRSIVNKEATEADLSKQPVYKRIMNIGDSDATAPAAVVDAKGERDRMKANQAAGKPVTQGETPTLDD